MTTDKSEDEPAHMHVVFELEQDEDGYPPVGSERLWALRRGPTTAELANIPFFATQAIIGDLIEFAEDSGVAVYVSAISRSGNALIRIAYNDHGSSVDLVDELRRRGCGVERDGIHSLLAVSVPPGVQLDAVRDYIAQETARLGFDYEEPRELPDSDA